MKPKQPKQYLNKEQQEKVITTLKVIFSKECKNKYKKK